MYVSCDGCGYDNDYDDFILKITNEITIWRDKMGPESTFVELSAILKFVSMWRNWKFFKSNFSWENVTGM